MTASDELVAFVDDGESPVLSTRSGGSTDSVSFPGRPWRVLIVDDDEDVHQVTRFSLSGVDFLGRPLEFLSAHSAEEAMALLRVESGIAIILLDVVMEDEHAGLGLVGRIRNELQLHKPRIILRTGQPGYAPELTAVRDYDINDYKTKSELTRTKLFTTLMAAIRTYDQICRIEASREGLELIVRSSAHLLQEQGLREFAAGVVTQLAALIGTRRDGLVCALHRQDGTDPEAPASGNSAAQGDQFVIIGAAGIFERFIQSDLSALDDDRVRDALKTCLRERRNLIRDDHVVIYFPSSVGTPFATFVDGPVRPGEIDERLLGVFCSNVALCAKSIHLVSQLREVAFRDPLVMLPNRAGLVDLLESRRAKDDADDHVLAVVDIDAFGEINNAFGHQQADQLLKAIARRLRQGLPDSCVVARLGGDAFGILGPQELVQPGTLHRLLNPSFKVGAHEQVVHAGIGLVRLRDSHGTAQSVLKDGFIALKLAKSGGLDGHCWFTADLGAQALERTRLLNSLEQAFGTDRLFAMYQPQVELATGRVLGFEALMRWRGDSGSLIGPDRFIPLAESSGLIVALGEWILRSALRTARDLHSQGHTSLRMAVNVSVVQFRDPGFPDTVARALREAGVPASMLELEVTESVAMIGAEFVRATLHRLRTLGVAIAVDDFGTGYSSLSYLESLPVDRLKIDRAFVQSLETGEGGGRIAQVVIDLGRQLGLRVLAEGVETQAHAERLRQMGCDEAQGYLFGRPMVQADLAGWLNRT